MESVAYRMTEARASIVSAVNAVLKKYELPAYIAAFIVADVLGEVRQSALLETIAEMEREHGNLDKDIQQDKLAKQTIQGNAPQPDKP